MLIPIYVPKDFPILRVVVQERQIRYHHYRELIL